MTTLAKIAHRLLVAELSGTGCRLTRAQVKVLADALRPCVPTPPTEPFDKKARAKIAATRAKPAATRAKPASSS